MGVAGEKPLLPRPLGPAQSTPYDDRSAQGVVDSPGVRIALEATVDSACSEIREA